MTQVNSIIFRIPTQAGHDISFACFPLDEQNKVAEEGQVFTVPEGDRYTELTFQHLVLVNLSEDKKRVTDGGLYSIGLDGEVLAGHPPAVHELTEDELQGFVASAIADLAEREPPTVQ